MDRRALVDQLRQQRRLTLAKFVSLNPARLQETRTWREKPAPLAHRLAWLAEGDDARCVRIQETRARLGAPLTVAQMALVSGGATRGRLLGTLVGVPDALRDQPPASEEWSVQRTLGHVIANDMRYRIAVEYALDRVRSGRGGPLRPPDEVLPSRTGEAEAMGTWDEVLARLMTARDEVIVSLASTPDDLLDAPTNWTLWDLDVRFRIHRFAAHDREHTSQIRRALDALGFVPNEVQLLLADAEVARGALEAALLCTPPNLLDRDPPGGGPTIAALAAESLEDERTI